MAQTAAQKKAAAAKIAAAKKEAAYIESLSNPITSQYDPRIAENMDIAPISTASSSNQTVMDLPVAKTKANEIKNADGSTTVIYSDGSYDIIPATKSTAVTDDPVYAAILASLGAYNISGLAGTLAQIRSDYPDISSEDMLALLRNDPRYNKGYLERFSGNAKLAAAGKPVLSEKEYLANEAAYAKIFKAYGVDRFANTAQYATLIGNELAPDEVGARVSMAYNRVLNADSHVLEALRKFGSSLSTGDLIAAMLDPKNQLPELERKITSAEIGGAALKQGLQAFEAATSVQSSKYSNVMGGTIGTEAAMQSGETGAQANVDYQAIARELPTTEFLSSISKGLPQYAQVEAEKARIQGLASEERKKQDLYALEQARWSGSSGAAQGAFSTGYLKRSSTAGLI